MSKHAMYMRRGGGQHQRAFPVVTLQEWVVENSQWSFYWAATGNPDRWQVQRRTWLGTAWGEPTTDEVAGTRRSVTSWGPSTIRHQARLRAVQGAAFGPYTDWLDTEDEP